MRDIKEIKVQGEVFNIVDSLGRALINTKYNELKALFNALPFKGGSNRRYLVVDKTGNGDYTTINAALSKALTMTRNANNRVTIYIMPSIYNEKIVGNFDYIDFIGLDRDSCVIEYPSVYPDCVIHVHGNVTFKNLTIHSTLTTSYCVHADYLDQRVPYELTFDNCRMFGGSNAIGHGSSQNSHLIIKNCILKGNAAPIYIHNAPYANSTGQKVDLIDNLITPVNNIAVLIDDAASGYGIQNSYLFINANGNLVDTLTAKVLFRPNPNNESLNRYWIGDETQIKITTGSAGNFNETLDYGGGEYILSAYVTLPSNDDGAGYYRTGIIVPVLATKYNRVLADVTLPNVGSLTNQFGIGAVTAHALELSTQSASCAGRTVSVTLRLQMA